MVPSVGWWLLLVVVAALSTEISGDHSLWWMPYDEEAIDCLFCN